MFTRLKRTGLGAFWTFSTWTMVASLASQELSARAATHDQHLKGGAQPCAAENTSNMWVLTWQRPLKNRPRLYLKCDCRPGLAGRVLTARSFLY